MVLSGRYTRFSDGIDVVSSERLMMVRCTLSDIDVQDLMNWQEKFGEITFILCFEGELTFQCGSRKIDLHRGEGFYNFHSEIYRFISQHEAILYLCSCSADFVSGLSISSSIKSIIMRMLINSHIFILPSGLRQECDHCFEMIKNESQYVNGLFHEESLQSLSAYLLYHTLNCISCRDGTLRPVKKIEPTPETHYNRFCLLLQENIRKERGLEFYADRLSITPAYLSSVVKRFSGKSGHGYISDMVILEIKNLLKSSSLNIKQISFEMNFPNPSFLTKFFRHHTGMTPMEYRRTE